MALDLADDDRFSVTVADIDEATLERLQAKEPKLSTVRADLSSPSKVTELVAGYSPVLSAVPGFMGSSTLEAIIEARRNVEAPSGKRCQARLSAITHSPQTSSRLGMKG